MGNDQNDQQFGELHFKRAALERLGLPDIPYPISFATLKATLQDGGELPLAAMLLGLQIRSAKGDAPWREQEAAKARLAELLAPYDPREVVVAEAEEWWLEIGPVDLESEILTIQRDDVLLAALCPREDGRLRVAVFRPLDARGVSMLLHGSVRPAPDGRVCMRENNWQYLLDQSASMAQAYAFSNGESYLSYWEKGLGMNLDGTVMPEWRRQKDQSPRPASHVATELGVYYSLAPDPL